MLACTLPLSCFLLLCFAVSTFGDTIPHDEPGSEMPSMPNPAIGQFADPGGPGTIPLDVEHYPIPPPELELEQVHVYVRHGELHDLLSSH